MQNLHCSGLPRVPNVTAGPGLGRIAGRGIAMSAPNPIPAGLQGKFLKYSN